MSNHNILLIEINHAHYPEPLRLMSGGGFRELRKDVSGQEIYGTTHEGREYLLFPMGFTKLADGILEVRVPATGERPFMRDKHGHRITFKSPHGEPYFSEMSEEYHTCTGIIRIDADDRATVELDRVSAR